MSTIIFEGNTYTFGATVSANPGTGTTSYVFGGLSSGWTYGFIIWAFNGFGSSSIVGPVTKLTLSEQPEELRTMIGAASYRWGEPIWSTTNNGSESILFSSGSTVNIFIDSETMSSTWWNSPTVTRLNSGITLPNGYTSGLIFRTDSSPNYYDLIQTPQILGGATYIFSFYMNTDSGVGSGGISYLLRWAGGSSTLIPNAQQILPQISSGGMTNAYNGNGVLLGPTAGQCGWVRYAIQFETTTIGKDAVQGTGEVYTIGLRTPNISGVRNYYIGAPQLEKIP